MGQYLVRNFRPDDADFISDLEERTFSTPMPKEYIRTIPQKNDTLFLVCEDVNGNRAGYAGMMWVLDEGSVISVAVDEDIRNESIGTLLMSALAERALAHNLSSLTLEVRSGNGAAIRLYEKNGFQKCGCMKNYYSFPKEDAIIMTRFFNEV